MIEVEKMGKPAVPIVSGRFEGDAISSSRAFAMPDLRFVLVPRIYRNLPNDECVRQTELAFDDLVQALTDETDGAVGQHGIDTEGAFRFECDDRFDAVLRMNEDFIGRDWGDSFPLLPATREAVDALIAGTCLPADHLVCDMPPGFGLATVEKIAVNAAMAGAKPEHMPVIIAAVKALSQVGGHGGKSLLMSTSAHAPMLVVNGPIAKEVGLNPRAALGPGRDNRVNIVIGRAFSLCLRNIGYWYPNQMDMDTVGTPRKFVHCIAENEDMSPWEPFHVNQGFNDRGQRGQRLHHRRGTGRSGPGEHHRRRAAQDHRLRRDLRHPQPGREPRRGAADTDAPRRSPHRGSRRLLQAGRQGVPPLPRQHQPGQDDSIYAPGRRSAG